MSNEIPAWWRNSKPFINGGLAGCIGLTIMQPVDMVKVRIQLGQGSLTQVVTNIFRNEGWRTFYNGWTAQMARQITYGTVRLGSFNWMKEKYTPTGSTLSFPVKVGLGLIAGTGGACAGNPAEVALIRMQADKMLPEAERRSYSNVVSAVFRIAREEGVATLWRGCAATILRASAVNGSSLATYDQTKDAVDAQMGTKTGPVAICCAGAVAGVTAACTSMPFDFVKTQVQQMRPDASGKMPFAGMTDCAMQTLKSKGAGAFYVGFPVYVARIAPAIAIIFYALEGVIMVQKKFGV